MAGFTINTHMISFFFFSIAVLFLLPIPSTSASTGPIITTQDVRLIRRVCSYSFEYANLCMASLYSRSDSRTANIAGLMIISLENAYKNGVTDSISLGTYAYETKDPVVRSVMHGCRNNYVDTVHAISNAKSAAQAKNIDETHTQISMAIYGVQQCSEELKKLQGRRSAAQFSVRDNDKELGLLNIASIIIELALR